MESVLTYRQPYTYNQLWMKFQSKTISSRTYTKHRSLQWRFLFKLQYVKRHVELTPKSLLITTGSLHLCQSSHPQSLRHSLKPDYHWRKLLRLRPLPCWNNDPDSKVHGANMGPTWVQVGPRWAPCLPHEPCYQRTSWWWIQWGPLHSIDHLMVVKYISRTIHQNCAVLVAHSWVNGHLRVCIEIFNE